METISDMIVNGRRKLVVKYTDEEKTVMKAKAKMQNRIGKRKAS